MWGPRGQTILPPTPPSPSPHSLSPLLPPHSPLSLPPLCCSPKSISILELTNEIFSLCSSKNFQNVRPTKSSTVALSTRFQTSSNHEALSPIKYSRNMVMCIGLKASFLQSNTRLVNRQQHLVMIRCIIPLSLIKKWSNYLLKMIRDSAIIIIIQAIFFQTTVVLLKDMILTSPLNF